MDPGTRVRLDRLARRGELAGDPHEAAIAVARKALRELRWSVVMAGVLLVLNLVSAAVVEDRTGLSLRIAVAALCVPVIVVFLLRNRPLLLRAERRNRELITPNGAGEADNRAG